jgi:alpha-beta hydrolase superfamily lysophospholipase
VARPNPSSALPWLPELVTNLAAFSGVGYLAAAYSVSRWLTKPTPGKPLRTPTDFGYSWEPLHCFTADKLRLVGWVVSPARPRGTVVLFHGVRQNRGNTLTRMAFLVAAGFRCVAFDHRAHGESDGRRTSFGYHERHDVAAVVELTRHLWPDEPLAVLGMSMGAAALCYAAEKTRECAAVILEGLYHDIATAFTNRLGTSYPPSFRRLARGVFWVTERRLAVSVEQLAPAEHVGRLTPAPVLLLAGGQDLHSTPVEAQRLHERCCQPCELWIVPGATHADILEIGGDMYRDRILAFLDRWCAPMQNLDRSVAA